jgi:hypothetical protein
LRDPRPPQHRRGPPPRRQAVFIRGDDGFVDRTLDVVHCEPIGNKVSVQFRSGRPYPYGVERCHIAYSRPVTIPKGNRILIDGTVWSNVVDVWEFDGPAGPWRRVIYLEVGYVEGNTAMVIVHAMRAREKFLR